MDPVTEMLPFLTLGALGSATLSVAVGALRSARKSEQLGEDRFELLRDQAERLELLREERRTLTEELEQEGRLHNHHERQRLAEELEAERLARSEDRREVGCLQREVKALVEELEGLWEERRPTSKGSKGQWGSLFGANNRY